jgi:hypothetical protein
MKAGAFATVRIALLGAAGFWSPDIVVHAIRRNHFGGSDVLIVSVIMPLALFASWAAATRYFGMTTSAVAIRMLPGIWLLGGLCMSIGASFSAGGFVGPEGIRGAAIVIGMSLLPIYTFMMATYDGSLLALLLVTAILSIAALLPLTRLKARPL